MMIEFTANDNLIKGATEEAKQDLVLDQNYSPLPQTHCPNAVQAEMPV